MARETVHTRRLEGVIVSDKMAKTVVVEVTRVKRHPKYGKYYRVSKRLKAHNEEGEYRAGERVVIEETRPLSREKRWRVVGRVEAGVPGAHAAEGGELGIQT
ncbi:MAG: 30S ribosomal protein S17 [Candidatus Colwellbacteria bacterium]|nr:30S ribosomal protein S17 [Candidatus Colwellbacteria bacterium]